MERDLRAIFNDDEYRSALAELSCLIDCEPDPDSSEGHRFKKLLTIVEVYEAQHFPMVDGS